MKAEDLPNYKHPDYVKMQPALKVLQDCYSDLENCKSDYLPKEQKEPAEAYKQRAERAVFDNRLRPTIESNAGLLTAFELTDMPSSVEMAEENIDNKGSSYKAFFQEADTLALRDGYCYILVDYPPTSGEVVTLADQMMSNRRPYLTLVDRRCLLNWRTHYEYGRLIIDSIVIEMSEELPDGEFGSRTQKLYHQLKRVEIPDPKKPNQTIWKVDHIVWEIDEKSAQPAAIERSRTPTTQREIPIVCYPYSAKPFNTDNPPFLKLARLNIKLFRKESDLDELEHKLVPTVFRKHPTSEIEPNLPPITLGPNWIIEVPAGGDVGVLEGAGSGVAPTQASIERLKQDINAEGLAFLSGARVERTATEAFLSSAQIQASLAGMARDKSSAIIRCFDFWCAYTGEQNTVQISMDHSLLEQPLDSAEMGVLLNLWDKDAISHETLLELLKMGKQLPPSFSIEEELQRVEEGRSAQMATVQPTMEQLLNPDPTMQTAPIAEQIGEQN